MEEALQALSDQGRRTMLELLKDHTATVSGRTRLEVAERGIPLGEICEHGSGWQAHVEGLGRYLGGGEGDRHSRQIAPTPDHDALAAELR